MIQPSHFYDLLDCLAGQFFNTNEALSLCVGDEFGLQISSAAKNYFSVAIIPDNLPGDKVVLGVLLDDSVRVSSRNGYTFVIYVDKKKIPKELYQILASVAISHEIAHFAHYYELFLKNDNTGIVAHSKFTHSVSIKMIGAVTQEQDSTSQTVIDEHSIKDLLERYRNFPKKHFSKGRDTLIDYKQLIDGFYSHLNIGKLIDEYYNSMSTQPPQR